MQADASLPAVTGLILAGGRATRMEHRDKGLQLLGGTTLVERVIGRLQPQVDTLAINANRNIADYQRFGFPVWPDNDPGQSTSISFNGPLDGVITGLRRCTTPYLLVVPCDCPFLPIDLAHRLMTALQHAGADAAVATSGLAGDARLQPTFCLMHRSVLTPLQQYLHNGGRRMDGWYGSAKVVNVLFDDDAQFANINTLEELETHAARLQKK